MKAKDMNEGQITHTFCTFCNYRRFVAQSEFWGCGCEEQKKDEECKYRLTMQKEANN